MRNHKRAILLLMLMLVIVVVTGMAALSRVRQNQSPVTVSEQATPIQEGVMTEKQSEHGKIISQQYEYMRNQKLRDLRGTGDLQVMIGTPNVPRLPNEPPFNLSVFLRDMLCDSDVVLTGEVKNKTSQLTKYGEFAFTDYELAVEDILKNNTTNPIQPNNNIIVTRPGGTIKLNGKVIRAIDVSFKPLEKGGRVLLFLKFIPATGAYRTFSSKGSFKLDGNELVKLTDEFLPEELESEKDAASFIANVRSEAANSCSK